MRLNQCCYHPSSCRTKGLAGSGFHRINVHVPCCCYQIPFFLQLLVFCCFHPSFFSALSFFAVLLLQVTHTHTRWCLELLKCWQGKTQQKLHFIEPIHLPSELLTTFLPCFFLFYIVGLLTALLFSFTFLPFSPTFYFFLKHTCALNC